MSGFTAKVGLACLTYWVHLVCGGDGGADGGDGGDDGGEGIDLCMSPLREEHAKLLCIDPP